MMLQKEKEPEDSDLLTNSIYLNDLLTNKSFSYTQNKIYFIKKIIKSIH